MSEFEAVSKALKIREGWAGLTVFEVVRRAFPEISPREVFRQARRGEIRTNGKTCDPRACVECGDVLTASERRPVRAPASRPARVDVRTETSAGPLHILREDEDLLVVSKPPGCASHPALGHAGDTLIERVLAHLGVSSKSPFRPGLANRLDLDTSGIVLIAKTRPAQRRLGRHFQRGLVRKLYLALAAGWPEPESGEVRVALPRHPDSRDRRRLPAGHPKLGGALQEAVTRFETLERLRQPLRSALLSVEILTGRTHQIRRHFSRLGHPVAGDSRYGDPEFNVDLRAVCGVRRLFLHAHRVSLAHPRSGEPLDLVSPLPDDLLGSLRALGGTAQVAPAPAGTACLRLAPGRCSGDPAGIEERGHG